MLGVSVDDLDAVSIKVEDGVAYIEGAVSFDQQRRLISRPAHGPTGVRNVMGRIKTENGPPGQARDCKPLAVAPPVLMHYYSLG
jgi:hypothetical protein